MRNWFRLFLFWERRKASAPVLVERRQPRMTTKTANDQLCASIDRFQKTVIRRQEDLLK